MNVLYIGRAVVVALALGVLHAHAQRATDAERVEKADPWAGHDRAKSVYYRAMELVEAGRTLDAIPILTQLAEDKHYKYLAMQTLGNIYLAGNGVPQDDAVAQRWYTLAPGAGEPEKILWHAESYCRGAPLTTADKVIRDPQQGLKLLEPMRDIYQHRVRTNYIRYLCGSRMEPPDPKAWGYHIDAYKHSFSPYENEIFNERDLKMVLRVEQIGRKYPLYDRRSAITTFQAQAIAGDVNSQLALFDAYSHGRGAPQDRTKAFEWAMKAAEGGDSYAQTLVGECYLDGYIPVVADASLALKWLTRAAGEGRHPTAAWLLHRAFRYGNAGIKVDRQKAAQYLTRCIELQGRMCESGTRSADSDLQKAFDK